MRALLCKQGKIMKFILFISLIFLLGACGKDHLSSPQSQSTNNLNAAMAILQIPLPGVVGGAPSLRIGSREVLLGSLSQQASNHLNELRNGQISVAPVSQSPLSRNYNVRYSGSESNAPCPFNPMAQCNVINLVFLEAY
jgi:hypothetical protein